MHKLKTKLAAFIIRNYYWLAIVAVAAFLRLYLLGSVPAGLTWDEAAIGYNGYAILTTRRDEWLVRLPISFKSFGDYKAPLAIYLNGPFTYFLGMHAWVVRLPFALSGVVAVVLIYYLVLEVTSGSQLTRWSAAAGASILALSPWHIHFTRVGFESGLALTLLLAGCYLLIVAARYVEIPKTSSKLASLLTAAAIFLIASLYTYHSAKIVTPLLAVATVLIFGGWNAWLKRWKELVIACVIGISALWPLLQDTVYGNGGTRASVLIFSQSMSWWQYAQIMAQNLLLHLSPNFLISGQTDTLRHGTGVWGVLLLSTYVAALFGFWYTIRYWMQHAYHGYFKLGVWGIATVIIGLLPAIMTWEVPHPNRALLTLPGFIALAVVGLAGVTESLQAKRLSQKYYFDKAWIGTFIGVHVLLFIGFWNYYLNQYPLHSSQAFGDGYLEAFEIARQYEKGAAGFPTVDKILFTSTYQQPYIFALFVRRTNPIWYQGGSLVKYEFTDRITAGDLERSNTLIVASPDMGLPIEQAKHIIYGSDGSIRFAIFVSKN